MQTQYCTTDDIIADFKGIKFAPYDPAPGATNTSTTLERLEEWIDEESAFIDGVISKIYQLPIDLIAFETAALILKRICIFRVSARVKNKNELKEEVTQRNSDEKYLQNFVRTPNDDLTAIGKKNLLLPGVPEIDDSGGFNSFASDSTGCCGPTFNTCKQQW